MKMSTVGIGRAGASLILALIFWLSLPTINPVQAVEPAGRSETYILVKFQGHVTESERNATAAQLGGELVRWIEPLHTAQIRLSNGEQRSLEALTAASIANPLVISVEPDGVVGGFPIIETFVQERQRLVEPSSIQSGPVQVNDPDLNDPDRVYAASLLEYTMAWRYTMGNPDVIIAVLDSGVDLDHPELVDRVVAGYDFVNDDDDPTDDHGHGTHVAGIIAATANNGIGAVGVCPGCSLMPVKVLDSSNVGSWSTVADGIVYAVDHGAKIINLSLGGTAKTQVVADAIDYAADQGVLVIAAAGNIRTDAPFYPAALDTVVAVSATRDDDTRWSLSNYGEWIDISAPGYAIFSTYNDLNNPYGGYTFMSGTSMAAPHVAGLAGLLLSQQMDRTATDLRSLIAVGAIDLGEPGKDIHFGHGRINVNRALSSGMPEIQMNAGLAGWVWQDQNENGVWEAEEETYAAPLTINVWTEAGEIVSSTVVGHDGDWKIENLKAGRYKVNAVLDDQLILTTDEEYTVQLTDSQRIFDLNFGVTIPEASPDGSTDTTPVTPPDPTPGTTPGTTPDTPPAGHEVYMPVITR